MRPRYVHRVTPSDVGARISLRRYLNDEGDVGDVLGDLVSYDDGTLVVESRTGPVKIAESAVLASRIVPPAPPPRAPRTAG